MRIRIHSPGMNTLHRTVHNTNGTVVHLVISYCILCSWEMFYWVFFTLNLNYFSFHCSQFHETRFARAAHFLLFQLRLQTNSKSSSGSRQIQSPAPAPTSTPTRSRPPLSSPLSWSSPSSSSPSSFYSYSYSSSTSS